MNLVSIEIFVSVLISSFFLSDTARILAYFPIPSLSHQVVFRPLTQELAKRGHEVVIITPDPVFENGKAPGNMTEIDVHDKSYQLWRENMVVLFDGVHTDTINVIEASEKMLLDIIESQLTIKEVTDMIAKEEKFDLILIEAAVRPALVISDIFKAPVIQISSFFIFPTNKDIVGAPSHPILLPEYYMQKLYGQTLVDKIINVRDSYRMRDVYARYLEVEDIGLKEIFGNDTSSIKELEKNVDMLMLNVNPIWEGNYPYPPNVVLLGGLHQKPEKPLPKDLKELLDSSKHGVIYMSFGTNVHPSQLSQDKIDVFNRVFSKLPYEVLWKWDLEHMNNKASNVKISKWFPQSDLLRHPKIKLFITQGGLQSTDESITAGVPLIAFPMLVDQWYNAEKYEHHKIGLHMKFETITDETLEKAIKNVVDDESYRQNVVRLRTLMNDQPQSPLERAVWWTEYVIRHKGAKHLKSPMANISWAA